MNSRDGIHRWREAGSGRRGLLLFLVSVQTFAGVYSIIKTLPYQGQARLELPLIVLFAVLFCWISVAFWTAVFGFIVIWRGRDRFDLTRGPLPHPKASSV